ncbi:MAG TPA: hypothetical protein VES19_12185 [Candidatus Limnocylindrales bacterium]|nr:hypothetical protein [Candidatus Limnocylindrales bacterium]
MRRTVMTLAVVIGLFAAAMVLFSLVIVPGMGDGAGVTPEPSVRAGVGAPAPGDLQATLLQAVPVRTALGGPVTVDAPDPVPLMVAAGNRVMILDRATGPTGQWAHVYVLPSQTDWPSDIHAWIPVALDGEPTLQPVAAAECPGEITLASLAGLAPQDRLRCAGGDELVLEGHTAFNPDTLAYNTSPAFFGAADLPTIVGLSAAGANRPVGWAAQGGPDLPIGPGPAVEAIPVGFDVTVTGRFDFPGAATCRRSQPETMGIVPVETAADSAAWCRTRFIVTAWAVVNGPEGKPPVAGEMQLHRHPASDACGGVGMPPLTLHIDPTAVDPVWLTAAGFEAPIIASFSDAFRGVTEPEPAIIDGKGLVLTDGASINPDAALGGHVVCPTGRVVYFG